MTRLVALSEDAGVAKSMFVFIGGGNMATAMIDGCVTSGFFSKEQVAISTRTDKSAVLWKDKSFKNVFTSNAEMISLFGTGVVVLSVKPQMRQDVFRSLPVNSLAKTGLIISLMSGIKTEVLRAELHETGFTGHIIRLMPNTPCAIGVGCTLLEASSDIPSAMVGIAREFASSVGICVNMDARCYNAGAAVAGCGPAWVYMFIESLADGGVLAGCSRADAMKLAAQTVMGAAKMVLESGEHPGALKDKVCSPGGTTIAGVLALEKGGFRSSVIEAVKAASDRADSI